MKVIDSLLFTLLIACITVALVGGQEGFFDYDSINSSSFTITEDSVIDEQIRQLAKNGRICKVIGHHWRNHMHMRAIPAVGGMEHDIPECRICETCELHQERTKTEWGVSDAD